MSDSVTPRRHSSKRSKLQGTWMKDTAAIVTTSNRCFLVLPPPHKDGQQPGASWCWSTTERPPLPSALWCWSTTQRPQLSAVQIVSCPDAVFFWIGCSESRFFSLSLFFSPADRRAVISSLCNSSNGRPRKISRVWHC